MWFLSARLAEVFASHKTHAKLGIRGLRLCFRASLPNVGGLFMNKRNWMVLALCATFGTAGLISCSDDVNEPVNPGKDHALSLTPGVINLKLGQAGASTARYTISNLAASDIDLDIRVDNEDCASSAVSSIKTDGNGQARINVTAGNKSCTTNVHVSAAANATITRSFEVRVSDTTGGDDPAIITIVSPANKQLNLEKKGDFKEISVAYNEANGAAIAETRINAANSNEDCITLRAGSVTTNLDGEADLRVTANGEDCSARVTFSVSGGKVEPAIVNVQVGTPKEYNGAVNITLDHSRINEIQELVVGVVPNCDAFNNLSDPQKIGNELTLTNDEVISGSGSKLELVRPRVTWAGSPITLYDISIASGQRSVVAYAISGDDNVIALGCVGGLSVDSKTVNLAMQVVPYSFHARYDLVTNFDLTSGFAPSQGGMPSVEFMVAGDWIGFMLKLFNDPLETLLDFFWTNTVARLKGVSGSNPAFDFIINFLVNDATKGIAIAVIKPMLETYLGETGDWYKIFRTISPDVADLISNMQLSGYMRVATTSANGTIINEGSQEYTDLQYQWSYSPTGGAPTGCMPDAYGNSTCRRRMQLNNKNAAINGSWNGTVRDGGSADGLLSINSHDLNFKWATILYSAVFGEILPNALGYNENVSIQQGQYIKGFLEKLVFMTVVDAYLQRPGAKPLTITGAGKECNRFLEALIYMIYEGDLGIVTPIISMMTDLACGSTGLGLLEEKVRESLGKFEAGTANNFKASSTDCTLHITNSMRYTSFGRADSKPVPSAHDIVTVKPPTKTTNRCQMNVDFAIGSETIILKGIYHAEY